MKRNLTAIVVGAVAIAFAPLQASAAAGVIVDDALGACINTQLRRAATTPITDADLAGLTALECSSKGITTLAGIEPAINLTRVNLAHNALLTDFSPLAGATKITSLEAHYSRLSSLDFLKNMADLEVCFANGSPKPIGQSAAINLADKTKLTRLTLNDVGLTDISWMSGLSNLTELTVSNNELTDVSVVANMPKLTNFIALANRISDISALEGLALLQQVNVRGNRVADVTPAAQAANGGVLRRTLQDLYGPTIYIPQGATEFK